MIVEVREVENAIFMLFSKKVLRLNSITFLILQKVYKIALKL